LTNLAQTHASGAGRLRALAADRGWAGHNTILGVTVLVALVLFAKDVSDMITIWWNASTYNHCLLIPFITAWLVAQRKAELARLSPRIFAPGIAFILASGLIWILGEAAGIGLIRQAAVVLMIQSLVLTLLGPVVTRGMLFPLFYLSFMVPAGEELVPILQTVTAKMSMVLLALFGVPAHINGIFITIPNGYFKVAEACSGVKFLVAMIAYGALVAHVCFRSWKRRTLFMVASVIVPVLANGLRAFGTIYVAHLTTSDAAAGFDHVIYGWFFFAFVMALLMGLGWRFFDRGVSDPWIANLGEAAVRPDKANRPLVFVLAILSLTVPLAWDVGVSASGRIAMSQQISLPVLPGWQRTNTQSRIAWAPHFKGSDHVLLGHYVSDRGDQVDLAVNIYAWQEEGRELIGFGQGAVGPDENWAWSADGAPIAGGKAERLVARGPTNREVVSFYVVGGKMTGRAGEVKLATLKARLFGGDQAATAILVSAVDQPNRPARDVINAFVAALGSPKGLADHYVATARGR
jgi:exosortase A